MKLWIRNLTKNVDKEIELPLLSKEEVADSLLTELAKINNISEDEVSDILATYDFLVDSSQYGLVDLVTEISKEEYDKIKEDKYEHKI